ncbi:MAG: hypothetical protein U5L74_15230 [Ideonella sp.]|nr:hypothetical protein [Ideonella sp.]
MHANTPPPARVALLAAALCAGLGASAPALAQTTGTIKNSGSVGAVFTISTEQNYYYATRAFKAKQDALCQVTSTIQVLDTTPPLAGSTTAFVRVAAKRNTVDSDDGILRHFLTSHGISGYQPPVTRTALMPITAGQTVQFGVSLSGATAWEGASMTVQTTYLCY